MKAERRHELEHNKLAEFIGRVVQRVQPYANAVLMAAVVVVVVVAVAFWWRSHSSKGQALAWDAVFNASATGNVAELDGIAEENAGSGAGQWATVLAADIRLGKGCQLLFTNKAEAIQELRKAVEAYTLVIDQSRDKRLRERAFFGRARAYEALCGTHQSEGELDKAIADYRHIAENVEKWPTRTYATMAARQLARLESEETRKFYDRFAAFTPKPPAPKGPGGPDAKSLFERMNLPDDGEFSKQILNLEDLKVKGTPPKAEASKPSKPEPSKGP